MRQDKDDDEDCEKGTLLMTTVRDEFEARPSVGRALGWGLEDGTLSGGERALAAVVHALEAHFDRLDGPDQQAVVDALAAVTADTLAAEADARAIFSGLRPQA